MAPFDRIVVPLDGAPFAERPLPVAAALAERTGVPIRLLSVAAPGQEAQLATHLTHLADRSPAAVDVETRVVGYGAIAKAITSAAGSRGLVCMSSHGGPGGAHTMLGGVTEQVLCSAATPVLVIGPRVSPLNGLDQGRVVACLDGSDFSERTLAPARQWSQVLGLPLWLTQVVAAHPTHALHSSPRVHLADLAGAMEGAAGWNVLRDRHPLRALAVFADSVPVALFVMATHGRSGWNRAVVGSLTTAAIHRLGVPILVVPTAVDAERSRAADRGTFDSGPAARARRS